MTAINNNDEGRCHFSLSLVLIGNLAAFQFYRVLVRIVVLVQSSVPSQRDPTAFNMFWPSHCIPCWHELSGCLACWLRGRYQIPGWLAQVLCCTLHAIPRIDPGVWL